MEAPQPLKPLSLYARVCEEIFRLKSARTTPFITQAGANKKSNRFSHACRGLVQRERD